MQLRVFIGTYRTKGKSCYALTIHKDKECMQMEPKIYPVSYSKHKLTLLGLENFLIDLSKLKGEWEITFYSYDDAVAFEWNKEYLTDKSFVSSTEDQDIWKRIIKITENNKISLSIYGEDNILTKLNKNEIRRARRII